MKNKTSLSKSDHLHHQAPNPIDIERRLLPRLKFMCYVMYTLSVATLLGAILAPKETDIGPEDLEPWAAPKTAGVSLGTEEDLLELHPTEVMNFYVISAIFALVGTSLVLVGKKKRELLLEGQPPPEDGK